MLPTIKNHPHLKGKRVLLRVDFNVSVDWESDTILSDFKIKRTIPTISFLRNEGAKVIMVSHIGRDSKLSLSPVYKYLKERMAINFWESLTDAYEKSQGMNEGEVVLLENILKWDGERENNREFAENLSKIADIYVNDAFAKSHRECASIVRVPKILPSFAGILFENEYLNLKDALEPTSPSFFILGGAKFETKRPLINEMSKIYDRVFIGGAIANDVLRARGVNVGRSLVSSDDKKTDFGNSEKIILPIDAVVEDVNGSKKIKDINKLKDNEKIMDIGPATYEKIGEKINKASFILWNGPLGYFEEGYDKYTKKAGSEIKESQSFSMVGGSDTIASLKDIEIESIFNFVSTAGGAMIEFLLNETLPGIEALKKSNR